MRTLKRNKRKVWYCLYQDEEEILDADGNDTGQKRLVYDEPVEMWVNVSPATGYAQTEQFGNLEGYDKVLVTSNMGLPLDENSMLFIDKEPEYTLDGDPMFDYRVRRVAKSLNSISVAVQKVNLS